MGVPATGRRQSTLRWVLGRLMTASGKPAFLQILLQKSTLAAVRIFGETLEREAIDNSYNLSHGTEVAYELSARR
jgi:hypothetical protein